MIRKLIFWPHLVIGIVAGLVILMLSVTGVALMYEKQIVRAYEWDSRAYAPAGVTEPMRVDDLVKKVVADGKPAPTKVTVWNDPKAPVELAIPKEGRLLVNAYTGQAIDNGAPKLREFMHWMIELHRWFAVDGPKRVFGRWLTWISNLAVIFLIVTGIYLWFPIKWTKAGWKAVTIFKPFAKGKARDWNWHTVLGFYTFPVLLFICISGLVIGDKRVNDWMFRTFGLDLAAQRQAATTQRSTTRPTQVAARAESDDDEDEAKPAATQPARAQRRRPPPPDVEPEVFARLWTAAVKHHPDWTMISTQWPIVRTGRATFSIDTGSSANNTQPMARKSLALNAADTAIVRDEGWTELHPARKARAVMRHGHTGEFLGFWGQTLAGVVSFVSCILVYTGFTLSWRRFFGKKKKKSRPAAVAAEKVEAVAVPSGSAH